MRGPRVLRPDEMYPAGDPTVFTHYVSTSSGIRVRIAECAQGGTRPLLLLHGWGCSLYAFRLLMQPLAAAGYRPIAVDLQGHGLSDKPPGADAYTLQAMTDHALAVMQAIGVHEWDLLGHSMGARIAAEIALRNPDNVRRLWLVNPVGFGPMPHVTMALPFVRESVARRVPAPLPSRVVRLPIAAVYGRVGSFTDRDIEEYRAPTQFREFILASTHLLRRFDWRVLDAESAEKLRDRTVLIVGELDRVVQVVKSGAHRRLIAGGWRVHVVPDVAHVVHEETPDAVMRVVQGI